jgi:hypothetical protein
LKYQKKAKNKPFIRAGGRRKFGIVSKCLPGEAVNNFYAAAFALLTKKYSGAGRLGNAWESIKSSKSTFLLYRL